MSTPGGKPLSDAVVLFDGKSLDAWMYTDGKPAGWIVKGGGLMTKREFGSMQLHIEWATPAPPKGAALHHPR